MTRAEFEQLRPWHDGLPTDPGFRPQRALVRKGYLRKVVDNFWELTDKAREEIAQIRGLA